MGMPCQVNSILKLSPSQYPESLELQTQHQVTKEGYRIIPIDVPIPLVDSDWLAHADVIIRQLVWENGNTTLKFEIQRIYEVPFSAKA